MVESKSQAAMEHRIAARPRTLVLLASFNGAAWIEEQLRTILGQANTDVHIVVRDDGSSDETIAIANRLRDPRIDLVRAAQASGSAAQNFFAMIREHPAEGCDYVAFADQDDAWGADKLHRASSALAATRAAGYSSAVTAVWANGRKRDIAQAASVSAADFLFEGAGQGCTFVLSKGFYGRVREFIDARPDLTRPIYFHDWAVYALARAWRLHWTFDPKPSMLYRQHTGNSLGARGSPRAVARRVSLLRDGWYAAQLRAIARLCAAAAPGDEQIGKWLDDLEQPDGLARRMRLARFCMLRGRRRPADRLVTAGAALMGWI